MKYGWVLKKKTIQQTLKKDIVLLSCLVAVIRVVQGICLRHPIKILRPELLAISARSVRRSLTS